MFLHTTIRADHIQTPLLATQRNAAIRELLQLVSAEISDSEVVYEAVLEREKIMTTGIGNGIAIPHCKNPACPDFVIALGISKAGIDFNSVDGKAVNLVFLLLGPDNAPNIHIKLLSRISRIMNREQVRTQCVQAASAQEVLQVITKAEKDTDSA